MKKALLVAVLLAITVAPISISANTFAKTPAKAVQSTSKNAVEQQGPDMDRPKPPCMEEQMKRRAEFEKKLKLTDAQKTQAKVIREKGRADIHPIMEKIKEKHQAIKTINANTKLSAQAKVTQTEQLKKEIGALRRYAHELQMKNMKEFESILTKKQLKTLNKMKKDGRKKFDKDFKKNHPQRPMFGPPPEGDDGDHQGPPPPPPED